jgi:hypothetical protein
MPATQPDRQNLDDLIQAHTDRLQVLHVQAARYGDDAPPHIPIEIDRIERELAQLKAATAFPVSDALVEELGPTGRYQLWMSHIMRLDTDIGRLRRAVEQIDAKLDQVLIALATKRPPRPRSRGQRKSAA